LIFNYRIAILLFVFHEKTAAERIGKISSVYSKTQNEERNKFSLRDGNIKFAKMFNDVFNELYVDL
jgi:hypothetical protein